MNVTIWGHALPDAHERHEPAGLLLTCCFPELALMAEPNRADRPACHTTRALCFMLSLAVAPAGWRHGRRWQSGHQIAHFVRFDREIMNQVASAGDFAGREASMRPPDGLHALSQPRAAADCWVLVLAMLRIMGPPRRWRRISSRLCAVAQVLRPGWCVRRPDSCWPRQNRHRPHPLATSWLVSLVLWPVRWPVCALRRHHANPRPCSPARAASLPHSAPDWSVGNPRNVSVTNSIRRTA